MSKVSTVRDFKVRVWAERGVIVFGLAAAALGFWAALVNMPDTIAVFEPSFRRLSGTLNSPDLAMLARQLKRQSFLSALAAACAGLSVLCQTIAVRSKN
jgi:hypothetical protein